MNRLRSRLRKVEKSIGDIVELVPGKTFIEAFKDRPGLVERFDSEKKYKVIWPDLNKRDLRSARELSTPELYGYMLSLKKLY